MSKDLITSDFGDTGENLAGGKGIQQVHIDLGSKTPSEIAEILRMVPRLSNAVFGDGYNWVGVVDDLRDLKKEVKALVSKMQTLENTVAVLQEQSARRIETSQQTRLLLWVILLVLLFLVFRTF
jgi:hypothetical protein